MRACALLFGALIAAPGPLFASAITYNVTVDTSSLNGSVGALDFQFNPGALTTQAADLQILQFTSDGSPLGLAFPQTGDVSGTLPGTLSFGNGAGFNDYFDAFQFGQSITFRVSLDGPALVSPDGSALSGSAFGFGLFSDPAGTVLALTSDPSGFAFMIDVNLDGTTTLSNFSAHTTVAPQVVVSPGPEPSPVPEPSSLWLFGLGGASLLVAARRRACWSPIAPVASLCR